MSIQPGAIQVLPQLPQKPQQQSQSMVKLSHFDSTENKARTDKSKIVHITNKIDIEVLPNKSCFVCVDYKYSYENLPFVYYTLLCPDQEFSIGHHLSEITLSTFTIKIYNKSLNTRKISIYYRVMQL